MLYLSRVSPVITHLCCGVLIASLGSDPAHGDKPDSPVSAVDSLDYLHYSDELRVELVACEPQVIDPVAIAFDESGRLWVVEMRDYPNGPAEGQPPLSRVRILRDTNGDGWYETSTTFADELLFATGVQPWAGGAIITLAGEVVWMKENFLSLG